MPDVEREGGGEVGRERESERERERAREREREKERETLSKRSEPAKSTRWSAPLISCSTHTHTHIRDVGSEEGKIVVSVVGGEEEGRT